MSFKIALHNVIDKSRKEGMIEGLSYSKLLVAEKIYSMYFHSMSRPSLNELYSVADLQTNNINQLFLALKVDKFVKENEK